MVKQMHAFAKIEAHGMRDRSLTWTMSSTKAAFSHCTWSVTASSSKRVERKILHNKGSQEQATVASVAYLA